MIDPNMLAMMRAVSYALAGMLGTRIVFTIAYTIGIGDSTKIKVAFVALMLMVITSAIMYGTTRKEEKE